MATMPAVTDQEVNSFIANQERVEAEQEQVQRDAERRLKEYEEQRLKGRSHWAIARKFADGATKGKGSRVFIEGNRIYSYGHHFVLATRKEEGDWGCSVKFIVNGDRYSVSTSGHTNLVIRECKPNVQIPYSALDAAGLTDSKWNGSTVPHPDLRVAAREDDRWYAVCRTCGKDVDTAGTFHLNDESDICHSPDDGKPWRYEHVLGGVVIELGGNYYLSGVDENEPWRLRSYFLCQLPNAVASIGQAYESLKPQRVRDAEVRGVEIRRQGDVFLVPVAGRDWNLTLRFGRDTLARDHRLWNGTHTASRALVADGRVFVSGRLTHERRQHRTLYCKGLWYEATKNTALASWNAVGHID